MKKLIMILIVSTFVISAMAQGTNAYPKHNGEQDEMQRPDRKKGDRMHDMSPDKKAEMQERRLQLMKKTLQDIGVTEEQRLQISETQKRHQEHMKLNSQKVNEAREKLSELEKSGASEKEIYAAVDVMSEAQGEQMKILIHNRMEMKKILEKEKYQQFMDAARSQYRKHGRRGGSGMPPRPGPPPLPEDNKDKSAPPLPETSQQQSCPPAPPA